MIRKKMKTTGLWIVAVLLVLWTPIGAQASAIVETAKTATPPSPGGINVHVRVECGVPGREGTVLARTPAYFADYLNDGDTYTALDALRQAVSDACVYTADGGAVIINDILGVSGNADTNQVNRSVWRFAVNDVPFDDSPDRYVLRNGDELMFWLAPETTRYAYFEPAYISAESSASFTLRLMAYGRNGKPEPVAGAELIIVPDDESVPVPLNLLYTDGDGQAELAFFAPVTYFITARLSEPEGVSGITRPFCEARISAKDSLIIQVEPERHPSDFQVVFGDIVVTEENDKPGISVWVEPSDPYPFALFNYDDETGELWLLGRVIALDESNRPIRDGENTLLPVRAVAEALGAAVSWDAETAAVSIQYQGETFRFFADASKSTVPVVIVRNRTYVSAEYLLQLLSTLL